MALSQRSALNAAPDFSLSESERHDWLRLWRAENVGAITFRMLLRRFGSAKSAIEALPDMAARGGKKSFKLPAAAIIDDEMRRTEKIGGRIIASCEADYPVALAAIEDAPPLITTRGDIAYLHKRSIGIVGARNASLNGRKMAETLARDLGREDIAIISGLARGIDASAHQGSLETGTVAAVAGGVDVVYPEENRALHERIAEDGCILSDMPLGCEPQAKLFPRRNRIISGLSLGIIVVEAADKSGSLITARMALEQGREVFAVPGSPLDPRCTGTNGLIRQGAVLTENARDVLSHIYGMPKLLAEPAQTEMKGFSESVDESDLAAAHEKILECLSPAPVAIDDLIRQCQLPAPVVLMVLLELELAGRVERHPGHRVSLIA